MIAIQKPGDARVCCYSAAVYVWGGGGGVLMFVIPNRRHGHLFEILRYMQVPPYYAI